MDADYNTALTLLLRYPSLEDDKSPRAFVIDAIFLRNHFNHAGASSLIEKYSGRPLPQPAEAPTSSLQPSQPGKSRMQLPNRTSSNFEDILQGAAKGMLQRGEKWGINKAFRDAMDEVRKGVREIQAVQTPQAPSRHSRGLSRQSGTSDRSTNASLRLAILEQRNSALATMLKKATDDLWQYHEAVVANKAEKDEQLQALSMAIAKVQFVQVYLDDATVPLPSDDATIDASKPDITESEHEPQTTDSAGVPANIEHGDAPKTGASNSSAQPNMTDNAKEDLATSTEAALQPAQDSPPKQTDISADVPRDFQTPRPSLAQSSFSWMLGQSPETTTDSFARAKPLAPSDVRRRSKGFLFGDDEGDDKHNGRNSPEKRKDGKRTKDRKKTAKKEVLFEQDEAVEEEFDLGALEEDKKREAVRGKV